MKLVLAFLVAALVLTDIERIALINSLKSDAKKAYQAGDYKTAAKKYQYLVDSLQVHEDEVVMNLANAFFHQNDSASATGRYKSIVQSPSSKMRSLANLQLGVLSNRIGKYEEALDYFKQSLRADPTNDEARYNYEMVKKKLEEQKKQEEQNKDQKKDDKEKKDDQNKDSKDKENKDQKQDQEKKDQDKKDQEKKDQQDQEKKEKEEQEKKDKEKSDQQKEQEQNEENKEKKDIPPSVSDKLKEMEMSEEKAKMILEAMKNQEIQYLQQNKRKATKPKDKTKPDW